MKTYLDINATVDDMKTYIRVLREDYEALHGEADHLRDRLALSRLT